jgi:hypothetical protein
MHATACRMHIVQLETHEPQETVSMGVTPTPVHEYEYEQTFQFALIGVSGSDKLKTTADKPGKNSYVSFLNKLATKFRRLRPYFLSSPTRQN